jgi:hypothetical protein
MLTFLGSIVLLLVIVLLLRIVRSAEKGTFTSGFGFGPRMVSSIFSALGEPSRIVVNGRTYASVDEMPPDVRAQYEQAMSLAMEATGQNRILDFPSGGRVRGRIAGSRAQTADPATRLKQLEEMKTSGLLTEEEYEAKRAQIIDAL